MRRLPELAPGPGFYVARLRQALWVVTSRWRHVTVFLTQHKTASPVLPGRSNSVTLCPLLVFLCESIAPYEVVLYNSQLLTFMGKAKSQLWALFTIPVNFCSQEHSRGSLSLWDFSQDSCLFNNLISYLAIMNLHYFPTRLGAS